MCKVYNQSSLAVTSRFAKGGMGSLGYGVLRATARLSEKKRQTDEPSRVETGTGIRRSGSKVQLSHRLRMFRFRSTPIATKVALVVPFFSSALSLLFGRVLDGWEILLDRSSQVGEVSS